MKRFRILIVAALMLPTSLAAQQSASSQKSSVTPTPAENPIAQSFHDFGGHFGGWLVAAFDSIPASKYGFRPTPSQQSVGYIAQHLEHANYVLCGRIGGMQHPTGAKDSLADTIKAMWPKDTLVARLRASLLFCRDAFTHLDDSKMADEVPSGPSASGERAPRVRALLFFVTDLAEHYSQIASYMRLLGMVPPSALPRTGPMDTVRAGQCSTAAMTEPDTTAGWFMVMRTWDREEPGEWSNDSLRADLLSLAAKDQEARQAISAERLEDSVFVRHIRATDSSNTVRMKALLSRYGWPGKSMVGARGAHAAFLLVQHSPELAPEALALMQAAKPGEVGPADLALLSDRQRTATGLPQVYGSQLDLPTDGVWRFFPIQDFAHVEQRRASAGLPPLRDYACMIATMYKGSVLLPDGVPQ